MQQELPRPDNDLRSLKQTFMFVCVRAGSHLHCRHLWLALASAALNPSPSSFLPISLSLSFCLCFFLSLTLFSAHRGAPFVEDLQVLAKETWTLWFPTGVFTQHASKIKRFGSKGSQRDKWCSPQIGQFVHWCYGPPIPPLPSGLFWL